MKSRLPEVPITELSVPSILSAAHGLPATGIVKITRDRLAYLDIDDEFIHRLQPLLVKQVDPAIRKPDYFGKKAAGAHITIFYPDEHQSLQNKDLKQQHTFTIKRLVDAKLFSQHYFVLLAEAPTLTALREKYSLPPRPRFKNHWIDFHITIGRL